MELKNDIETALMLRLKNGDARAVEEVYDRYSSALFGILKKITLDEAAAADLLQDAFVKIWKYAPGYDPAKGRPFTWMLNIARNAAIDFLRKKKNAASPIRIENEAVSLADEAPRGDELADAASLREKVSRLPADLRAIIDLLYLRGYTHSEAAKTLGIPEGTLKTRVRIAIRELRKMLA